MPWKPNGRALRALREKRGWTLDELASKSGVSDRQIRAIESPNPPATIQMRTIRDLSGALKCEREAIADWVDARPTGAPAHAAPEVASKLPPASTLARRAAAERKAKIRPRHVAAADGAAVEVLGFDRLYEVDAAFAAFSENGGARFAVEGTVAEHRAIPRYVEPVLDVQSGVGAQFLIVRKVAREPLYVSVFTRSVEHTRRLIEAERAGQPVVVIARVAVARPRGEWKGFFIFEKQPKPHPWALVVDEVAI
jgi:transcriptional regulator with XRE-family HTH domain